MTILNHNSTAIINKLNSIEEFEPIERLSLDMGEDKSTRNNQNGETSNKNYEDNMLSGGMSSIRNPNINKIDSEFGKINIDSIGTIEGIEKIKPVSSSQESEVLLNKGSPNEFQSKRRNAQEAMMKEFIRDLEMRVTLLEQKEENQGTKVSNLERDNERLKKMVGYGESRRQSVKKEELKSNQQNERRLSRESQIASENALTCQESIIPESGLEKIEEEEPENSFIIQINREISEFKNSVSSKMTILQESFESYVKNTIDNKNELTNLKQQAKVNRASIESLEEREKENIIKANNCLRGSDSSETDGKRASFNSRTRTSNSEVNLNDTVESYKNYYEDKIVEIFEQMDKIRMEYFSMVEKISSEENVNLNDQEKLKSLASKISAIQLPSEEKMKKEISMLKREVKKLKEEFGEMIGDVNTGANETRTLIIKPNENKEDWKNLTQKMFKLRQELLTYVKELEGKIETNNDALLMLHELEISVSECKMLNAKKVSIIDFEKQGKRIEGRLNNFIRQVCEKEGMMEEQEGLLVKQPWFCLSCDSEIKNHPSKHGKSVFLGDKMPGKKVNPELHTIRRPDGSKLPSVHH